MRTSANKAMNFLIRDWRINTSYRLSFAMSFAGIFVSVTMFFFISQLFGGAFSPYLNEYGGDYFSFVLIGLAFSGFVNTGLSAFSSSISRAQAQGTLEAMLVTPTRLSAIVLFSSLWSYAFNFFNVLVYLVFGSLFFGLSLSNANIPATLLVLFLATLIFSGIGIISASFIMVFKRGNPIDWLHRMASTVLSGMFFPITVLPLWLQPFAYVVPIFYALQAMRLAVLKGYSISALSSELLVLLGMTIVILPLSMRAFKYAVREAKKDGTLVTY